MSSGSNEFSIVGAGLAGALMANFLGAAGYSVRLIERRGDPRGRDVDGGRSINLAISTRGLDALDRVGLKQAVLDQAVPMRGRMVHGLDGSTQLQPYGVQRSEVINSVSRLGLNILLLEAADRLNSVTLEFDRRCRDIDLETPSLTLEHGPSGKQEHREVDLLIGADGAFSAIRGRMQRQDRFDYQQSYLDYGYKELTIPPGPQHGDRLERNALHIWPRGRFMMIALPNVDGSFTCTLFFPFDGPVDSFAAVSDGAAALEYFRRVFPDAVPLMPELVEEFDENPTSSLVTIRCNPWVQGRVALLGDASHAVVPFYGQGANAAFEDCTVLSECLERLAPDYEAAFADYQRLRKPHADALAQLAIDNFVEMRDKVADPWFRARNRFEKLLHKVLGARYIPLYSMVTFSRIPYAQARSRADSQWRKVQRLGWGVGLLAALAAIVAGVRHL